MSSGAKAMQILFIIAGTFAIAFGVLGSMAESDDKKNTEWTCYPPTRPVDPQHCEGEMTGADQQIATNFILGGIGLQIAAAACAIGGRRDAPVPMPPYAMPTQSLGYPPRPAMGVPGSPVVPAQAPPPAWPSA